MNSVQKTILMIGLLVFCFVNIYAPYQQTIVNEQGSVTVPAGRYFIFATPKAESGTGLAVDMSRALLQSAAIAAFTAGYIVFATCKKQ